MKIAIIASDMTEEAELVKPRQALDDAGYDTYLIAPDKNEIVTANHHDKSTSYPVDEKLDNIDAEDFDGVLLPGGALNADFLRTNDKLQEFLQDMDEAGKPIAFICHAPWELISAGLVEGRTLTGYFTIADDIRNAGGEFQDRPVVTDDNWVSSRKPDDIPLFNSAMLELFAESKARLAHSR
jgi:protease I